MNMKVVMSCHVLYGRALVVCFLLLSYVVIVLVLCVLVLEELENVDWKESVLKVR